MKEDRVLKTQLKIEFWKLNWRLSFYYRIPVVQKCLKISLIWETILYRSLGCVYDLTAVLIHRGLSAYSGHYIAHIKDKKVLLAVLDRAFLIT